MSIIGDRYHQETKYRRDDMPMGGLDWSSQPGVYKDYPGAAVVELGSFEERKGDSLFWAIKNRRSVREYAERPLSKEALSYLLAVNAKFWAI
ncbi:hypothetical protein ACFL02_08465 [Planctomycetota bacterium]